MIPISFPRNEPVGSPYVLEVELMQTCCTGIKWHIMGRRDTPILSRAQCHREGVRIQVNGPLQEVL